MIKKYFNKLSAYPRLRILLLIVLVVVFFIVLANVIGLFTPKRAQTAIPASMLAEGRAQVSQANPIEAQRYKETEQKIAQAEYQKRVNQGGSVFDAFGAAQQAQADEQSGSTPQQAPKKEKELTPAEYAQLLEKRLGNAKKDSLRARKGGQAASAAQGADLNYSSLVNQADQSQPSTTGDGQNQDGSNQQLAEEEGRFNALLASQQNKGKSSTNSPKSQPVHLPAEVVQSLESQMQSQLQGLQNGWALPKLATVAAPQTKAAGQGAGGLNTPSVIIKAGTVYYGVLITAVDSDQTSAPIMAQVVNGPYDGARLMGKFTLEGEKLVVQFTTMTMPQWPTALPIQAYAINGTTAANALSGDVDHHYFLRYGSLFAAAFLQGFGNAFSQLQNYCNPNAENCTIIGGQINPRPTTRQAFYQGLGQIGTSLSGEVAQNFNRPVTVTISQGTGIGLLFTKDVTLGGSVGTGDSGNASSNSSTASGSTNSAQNVENEIQNEAKRLLSAQ